MRLRQLWYPRRTETLTAFGITVFDLSTASSRFCDDTEVVVGYLAPRRAPLGPDQEVYLRKIEKLEVE